MNLPVATDKISRLIRSIRGQRIILDADLAEIYGVETRALNQAVKRNVDRFPDDFLFELTRDEILRISQTVTSLLMCVCVNAGVMELISCAPCPCLSDASVG
jgi:hypothetical protein